MDLQKHRHIYQAKQLIYPIDGEPRWIHVSYKSKKDNRKQALEIKRKGKYYTYTGCKNC